MSNQTTVTTQRKKKLPIAGQSVDLDAELQGVRGRASASASASTAERRAVGRRHGRPRRSRSPSARRSRSSSAASPSAHDFLIEGALRGIGYKVQVLDVPDNEGFQAGKEFGNRGQCNPTYFTVGNLVKYLDHAARQARHDRRGDRQEVRVPHRRRVRPVPLRHVRHRVPQGAPRRRLRRLPRHALPADGRPQAGDRRRASASS